jgi:hypothetical protein
MYKPKVSQKLHKDLEQNMINQITKPREAANTHTDYL